MAGTVFNVIGILAGGVAGLLRRTPVSGANENFFKVVLAVFTVWFGLRLTWLSLNGTFLQVLKQLGIILLALMLGKLTGHFLRLQKFSNEIGRRASKSINEATGKASAGLGFKVSASLFCAAPLGIFGAVVDGLAGYFAPLVVKGVMDGLATMGFVRMFGWGPILGALPVFAFQGTLSLVCMVLVKPALAAHGLMDPVTGVAGLLIFSVSLVILGLKKLALADYVPSLVFAPLLASLLLK
jgi:uncharacterized membrane protein YqgA involved in biofilm formation